MIVSSGATSFDYPHHDLFAVRTNPANRSQLQFVPLTDLYGSLSINSLSTGWSNDSNAGADSFVTALATDIRDTFVEAEDGTTSYDSRETVLVRIRLPLTAADISAAAASSEYLPFGADPLDELQLDSLLLPNVKNYAGEEGMLSPDGSLYLSTDLPDIRLFIDDVYQPNPANPVLLLWDDNFGAPTRMLNARWSPDGSTVTFEDDHGASTKGGSVWIQPASAALPPVKLLTQTSKSGTVVTYFDPIWSPDSLYVAAIRREYRSNVFRNARLARIALGETNSVNVSTAITVDTTFVPLRWCSN